MTDTGRYWDKSWSLVDGCTPCSPGCDHCWSAAMAHRVRRDLTGRLGDETGPIGFNGLVFTRPDRLSILLKRRKPTVYSIWNDLFHKEVPDQFRIDALEVMEEANQHTFLVPTKRPREMVALLDGRLHDNLAWRIL